MQVDVGCGERARQIHLVGYQRCVAGRANGRAGRIQRSAGGRERQGAIDRQASRIEIAAGLRDRDAGECAPQRSARFCETAGDVEHASTADGAVALAIRRRIQRPVDCQVAVCNRQRAVEAGLICHS